MSVEQIAVYFGISPPTLRKHCAEELSMVAFQKQGEAIQALFKAAKKGNVSAIKRYLEMGASIVPAPLPDTGVGKEEGSKPVALGKKEQANKDAVGAQAGTEWADVLPDNGSARLH